MKQLSIVAWITALATLPLAAAAPAASQTRDPSRIAALVDSVAAAALADGRAAGMSIAVSRGGRPVVTRGYGYADLKWQVPTPERAIYAIGSVTKQFTAAAVLQLAEQRRIDLDADVTEYLPQLDTRGRRIPVRRLLDHTSGIASYTSMPEMRDDLGLKVLPRDTLVKLLSRKPFLFEPGEMEVYNNSGFFLLGLLIEKVTGQTYADYVRTNLFQRAGMRDSRYCSDNEIVPGMVSGYEMAEGVLRHARQITHTWPYAAGSLCSTAADLDAWNRALHGGKILGPAAYRAMITPGTLNDGSPLRYAQGIAVSDIAGHRAFHHGGAIDGFLSQLSYFPDEQLSVAVLVNTMGPVRPEEIARALAEIVLGRPERRTTPLPGRLADYAGEYRGRGGHGEDLTVSVVADPAGGLVLQGRLARPDAPGTLVHVSGDTFQLDDKQLSFVREEGRVAKLRVDAVFAQFVLRRQP